MQKTHSLGKDAVLLSISKIVTLLIAMITSMMLSRFCTFEEYGTYSQLTLIVTLCTSIFMLGLPNSINYFLSKATSEAEQQRFLGVYYTLSTILSFIMGITLACMIPLLASYFKNPTILEFVYFLLLYPWANVIASSIENILVVYHKAALLVKYRFFNSISLLGIILIIQYIGLGFKDYMIANVMAWCLFAGIVYYISYRISGGFHICFDKSLIKTIFIFSLPLGLSSVVGTMNIEIDKLLVGFLLDTEQLAIYTNASKELPVSFIASSITAVLLPQLTRLLKKNRNIEALKLWSSATEVSYILVCLISIGVFVYAEDVMSLLYSEKYLSGLPVFRVYTLVLLLRCTYFGIILNAKGKTKEIFYASVMSLALNAVLNPLLYWWLGMIGPAIATFISMFVVLLWQLHQTAQNTGVSISKVFPWKRIAGITCINVIFGFIFGLLKEVLPLEHWLASAGEAIFLGVCWGLSYLFIMKKSLKNAWHGLNQGENVDEYT